MRTAGSPHRFRTGLGLLPFALTVLAGAAACSTAPDPAPSTSTTPSSVPPSVSPTTAPTAVSDGSSRPPEPSAAEVMRVRVLVGDKVFAAELYDNPTARDLVARLPVTLTAADLNGVEKSGRLPFALTTDGVPRGSDPEVDEIGYYPPGRDLVLYYGDVGYFDGIIRIGRFGESISSIGDGPGSLSVTVERA